MFALTNYRLGSELYASRSSIVVRAHREPDGLAVVIKRPRDDVPTREMAIRLEREFAILKALRLPEAATPVALERVGNSLALVLEDSGGTPTDIVARRPGFGTLEFLRLAIAITAAVRAVHARGVIHKDLKPQHLLVDPEGKVTILDFGLSTELANERCQHVDPDSLEGTLAYIAPEQTGRVNRPVDRRSDLYALGVTFFELATGQLPFSSRDPLELVHAHIAKTAPRADAVRPSLPPPVASIIAKLMAKAAEDRYQSASGLHADLERCLTELEANGAVTPFELGTQDLSEVLHLPQALYGRASALAVLEATFEQARSGTPQLLLVCGPSGIGKSALVEELRRHLCLSAHFVAGKFDQLGRSEPYSALVAACRELVRAVLTAPAEALQARRAALLAALGGNARLVIELVPELELVVGPHPPPPPLEPSEAQVRFEGAFVAFLGALLTADAPLVIFIDDLQWADAPSLRLLRRLVTALRRPMLVLGAFREEEVSGLHPLLLELADLEAGPTPITRVQLGPLEQGDVSRLVADALRRPVPEVAALAAVLFDKTGGNPFHLGQFLLALVRDRLVRPDLERHRWVWDLPAIEARPLAANVVALVLERLGALNPEARRLVSLAACVGHEFDARTMAVIAELDGRALARGLRAALQEGVLIPLDSHYRYLELELAAADPSRELNARIAFAHDRLQQAAYELIEGPQRPQVHLRLGRLLRSRLGDAPTEAQRFAVAHQLNQGAASIDDPEERRWLARLNLSIATRAQASAATAVALEHATQVLAVLGDEGWTEEHQLACAARLTQAQCEYLDGRLPRALERLDDLDARAHQVLDRVAAGNLRTAILTRLDRLLDACRTTSATIGLLGAELPEPEDLVRVGEAIGVELAAVQDALAGRELSSLVDLPEMTDPLRLAELRTLAGALPAANQAFSELMVLIVLKGTRLLLEHGATDLLSSFLEQYAVAHMAMTGDHATAYRYGKLAIELGSARRNLAAVGPAHFLFATFISHWQAPIDESLEHFGLGLRRCLELGDDLHAASCVATGLLYQLHAGRSLDEVREALPSAFETVDRMGDRLNRGLLELVRRTVACLSHEDSVGGDLGGDGLEGAQLEADAPRSTLPWLHAARAWVRYQAGHHAKALAATSTSEPAMGLVATIELRFYGALSHAALARAAEDESEGRRHHVKHLAKSVEQFTRWAALAPANHEHRRALLAAELAELQGQPTLAAEEYDAAIAGARSGGFLQNLALACERSGEFYLRAGRRRIARAYLDDAVLAYQSWGAGGKAEALVSTHAELELSRRPGDAQRLDARLASVSSTPVSQSGSSRPGRGASFTLDLEAAMRATQAIASELESDRLLDRLLRLLVENAGAQRGLLLAPTDTGLGVEAERTVEPDEVHLRQGAPLSSESAPEQLIRYVARTCETVVLGDASADAGAFREDAYLRGGAVRSILCVALLHQGQLGAVVYLENRLTPHVFSAARVARIQFLATHAASALANARLYAQVQASRRELESRVRARTAELSQRNGDLKGVFDAVKQGLVTLDRGGDVVGEVSAAATSWLGPIPEGTRWDRLLERVDASAAQGFAAAFARLVAGGSPLASAPELGPRKLTVGGRTLELELRPVGDAAAWTRLLVVISDVTDAERQKQLEVELRHAQKLQSVGQLAAGIAHEINTPAQFVGDSLSFLKDAFGDLRGLLGEYQRALATLDTGSSPELVRGALAQAEAAADLGFVDENAPAAFERAMDGVSRISTLVAAMKEFAHPPQREKASADLNRALRTTLTIAKNEYKHVADVELELGAMPEVSCHLSDLNQVFLNLIVNAAQAIAPVATETGARGLIRVRSALEGDRVRIEVEDTGCGIPEEIRGRVFDPFFTTKDVGQGTGQGLAIARSIVVDKHGGTLTFDSVVGEGTTFTIILPVGETAHPS